MPEFLHGALSTAMGDALLLPIGLSVVGILASLCFAPPVDTGAWHED